MKFSRLASILCCTLKLSLIAFVSAGCGSLLPKERSQQTRVAQKEMLASASRESFERAVKSETPTITMPAITVSGSSNTVALTVAPPKVETVTRLAATNTVNTVETSASEEKKTVTIPLFVKLIGSAVGLAMLFAVIAVALWYARKHSAAAAAGLDAADRHLASAIATVESKLNTAAPSDQSQLLSQLADLNKLRGKIAVQQTPPT